MSYCIAGPSPTSEIEDADTVLFTNIHQLQDVNMKQLETIHRMRAEHQNDVKVAVDEVTDKSMRELQTISAQLDEMTAKHEQLTRELAEARNACAEWEKIGGVEQVCSEVLFLPYTM